MSRYVAFLRGINVGKAKRVSMAELKKVLTAAGFANVQTLLNSGNVVLDSKLAEDKIARAVERAVKGELGVESEVIVRSGDELRAAIAADPLGKVADNPSRHYLGFLSAAPAKTALKGIDLAKLAPEQVVIKGRELYLWVPGGVIDSKLLKVVTEKQLGVSMTLRNWNTCLKLEAMLDR